MESFIIEGGRRLHGSIQPQGAKNEALQVICASILTKEEVRISNIPNILDVNTLIKLLQDIGVKVVPHARNDYSFKADELNLDMLQPMPKSIGICGATSTPMWQMEEVASKLKEILEIN